MDLSPSWEASSCLANFMEPQDPLPCSQSPPLVPIISQISPVRTTPFCISLIRFNIIIPLASVKCLPLCRDSSVGIATGYRLDDEGIRVRILVGWRIFSMSSKPVLGPTYPPIQRVQGAKAAGTESWPLTSKYCRGQENLTIPPCSLMA
jgi:hypothetical protein